MTQASFSPSLPAAVQEAASLSVEPVTSTDGLTLVSERRTNRWVGIGGVALGFLGVGAILANPGLLMVAALGIGYALYYRIQEPPTPALTLRRTISETTPETDDEVEVALEVVNHGSRPVTDLRVVDGVPSSLTVTEGSPRRSTALRPGQRMRLEYTVETPRGHHEFDPATIIVRDIAGTHERIFEATTPSRIHAEPIEEPLPPMTLRAIASGSTGRIETTEGGAGVEFFAVREYRPGDPLNRIDWNRRARSGELATVEFRLEQMATVVLVIDIRPSAQVGRPDAGQSASELSIDAAAALFFSLLDEGDRVGVTTLGEHPCWLPPGIGADHREHGRLLFSAHPNLSPQRTRGTVSVITEEWALDHRIPDDTQLVFLSPMADGGAAQYATRFEARGHPVTVLSPDPTVTDTAGRTVAAIERQLRIRRLREHGIRVIDWDAEEDSLAAVLERAASRWSG